MFVRSRKAQSTLEYVIVVVGIVVAIIAAKTLFGSKVEKMVGKDSADAISKSTDNFVSSFDGYGK
jgi:uncharacterized protein (UPF0333 family)